MFSDLDALLVASSAEQAVSGLLGETRALLRLAFDAIERENRSLKGVLPKVYALPGLNKDNLGKLIDIVK